MDSHPARTSPRLPFIQCTRSPPMRCIIQCSSPLSRSCVDGGFCPGVNPSTRSHPSSSYLAEPEGPRIHARG